MGRFLDILSFCHTSGLGHLPPEGYGVARLKFQWDIKDIWYYSDNIYYTEIEMWSSQW